MTLLTQALWTICGGIQVPKQQLAWVPILAYGVTLNSHPACVVDVAY